MLALGVGLTDECQLACAFCYSMPHGGRRLDPDKLVRLLGLFDVGTVNFGTGESILHPRFVETVERCAALVPRLSVTTNGLTLSLLDDAHVKLFHDVDFSLDHPDPATQDAWRGGPSFQPVVEGLRRCRDLGVPASVVTVVLRDNVLELPRILDLARQHGAALRLNLYKDVRGRSLAPERSLFWDGMQRLFRDAFLVSCSEPVLAAHPAIGSAGGGRLCGVTSLRIKPGGGLSACPFDVEDALTLDEVLEDPTRLQLWMDGNRAAPALPALCRPCPEATSCAGGCLSRRRLGDGVGSLDEFCPGEGTAFPPLVVRRKEGANRVHADYLCTVILE